MRRIEFFTTQNLAAMTSFITVYYLFRTDTDLISRAIREILAA
jgi:hypothetical protein